MFDKLRCRIEGHEFKRIGRQKIGYTIEKHVRCLKCTMYVIIIYSDLPRSEWYFKEPLRRELKTFTTRNSRKREVKRLLKRYGFK